MLSIGAMGGGQGNYYLSLAREDYYLEGGEPLGRWWGRGAEKLDLPRIVQRDHLRALLKGERADGSPLIQNAGRKSHQPGWDLTFSAPKGVSTLWSQADEETRKIIQIAHHQAVQEALSYLQDEAAFTRRGKAGRIIEPAGLIVATFEHGTSRAQDPQLHTHALVMNACTRLDGTTGTLVSKNLYKHKMVAGALYRAALAEKLEERLNIHCEREKKGNSFTVKGIGDALNDFFSKRREAIEQKLKSGGSHSAAAAAVAALDTRDIKKEAPPRAELFKTWQGVGREFAFNIDRVLNQKLTRSNEALEFREALHAALIKITDSNSHFTDRQLLQHTAVEAQGRGLSARYIRDALKKVLAASGELVSLGIYDGERRYTTPAVLEIERKLIEAADRLERNKKHGMKMRDREPLIFELGKQLTEEQKDAVRHLTQKGGGLRSLEGLAGTGKTSTLKVVREILERKGYTVIGTTLSAKAARELKEGSGIDSRTIAKLTLQMNPTRGRKFKHVGKQLVRASRNKKTYKFRPLKFDKNTVLVIDEAGMVGTPELARLTAAVEKAGGMLINVFDRKQLQAIGPGGGAAFLADKHGKAQLKKIIRQRDARDVESVIAFSKGEAKEALKILQERGKVRVADNREKAIAELVREWTAKEAGRREDALIFVGTRAEVADLNQRCQAARLNARELQGSSYGRGQDKFFTDDRVLFTKNSKTIGVENGTLGTIISFQRLSHIATVKLDDGRTVQVPLRSYKHIQLGYAVTTHKGQGTTVEAAYLLAGGKMQDRELSYVQASRARREMRIYADRNEAGRDLSQLAKQMSESRLKTTAHEMRKIIESPPPQTINIQQQQMRI